MFEKVSPDEHAMAHSTPRTAETQRRRVRYLEHVLAGNGHVVSLDGVTALSQGSSS
jgi:hypothetical protein